jgi:uncharacterized protein involved in exopolysaccharide biosynthesis
MMRFLLTAVSIFMFASFCRAQTSGSVTKKTVPTQTATSAVKSSPAYAELLLRRTERESELEGLLLDYTEEFPKVKEIKFEMELLKKEMDKIAAVNAAESGKLTLALGKLIVRKVEIEADLWNLRLQYKDDHAEVRRAKRKVEIYERAIKEIL